MLVFINQISLVVLLGTVKVSKYKKEKLESCFKVNGNIYGIFLKINYFLTFCLLPRTT